MTKTALVDYSSHSMDLECPTDEAEVEKLIAPLRPANPELSYKLEAESFKFPRLFFEDNLGFTHFAECHE